MHSMNSFGISKIFLLSRQEKKCFAPWDIVSVFHLFSNDIRPWYAFEFENHDFHKCSNIFTAPFHILVFRLCQMCIFALYRDLLARLVEIEVTEKKTYEFWMLKQILTDFTYGTEICDEGEENEKSYVCSILSTINKIRWDQSIKCQLPAYEMVIRHTLFSKSTWLKKKQTILCIHLLTVHEKY